MKQGRTCLLIDDDQDDQDIFNLALHHISPEFKCLLASSGYEALEMLTGKNPVLPDYIFLDLNMPRMNGKECLCELRKHSHLKAIPVIIYSTSSLKSDVAETRALGAADFITKPHSIIDLTRILYSFFKTQQEPLLC